MASPACAATTAPVPYRHFTLTIPKMLRPYFRFHRGLIKELCRIAHSCLTEFQLTTLGLPEGEVIDVSAFNSRRIPSKKWRELIKKVWEADPLLCPHCQNEMRIVALIHEVEVIERILCHLGLWKAGVRVDAARDPPKPAEPVIEPWFDDPLPDYEHKPVFAENGEPRQRRGPPWRLSFPPTHTPTEPGISRCSRCGARLEPQNGER
jgi:hypothetical protein